MSIEEVIASLNFGDRIDVLWFDASEATTTPERAKWDTYVHSTGWFLGVKGKRRRHVVIAKEIVNSGSAYHYDVILVEMIDRIDIIQRNALQQQQVKTLKRFVEQTIKKLRGVDGWIYDRGQDKGSLH